MRKSLVFVIVVLAAVVLLAPIGMGYLSRSDINSIMNTYLQKQPIKVKVENIHNGWMHSSFDIQSIPTNVKQFPKKLLTFFYELDGQGNIVDEHFKAHVVLQHGPVLFTLNEKMKKFDWHLGRGSFSSKIIFDKTATAELNKYLGAVPDIQSHTLITLAGNFEEVGEVAPIKIDNPTLHYAANWQGTQYQFNTNSDFTAFNFTWNFLPLTVKTPSFDLKLGNMLFKNNSSERNQFKVWTGNNLINVDHLMFSGHDGNGHLNKLNVVNTQTLVGNKLNMDMKVDVANMAIDAKQYGPFKLDLAAKGVDAASFVKLKDAVKKLDDHPGQSRQIREAKVMAMVPLAVNLVNEGADIKLNEFKLVTAEGNLEATGDVQLAKVAKGGSSIIAIAQNLMTNTKAKLSFSVSKKLLMSSFGGKVNKAPVKPEGSAIKLKGPQSRINKLVKKGLLIESGDNLKMVANYNNGKLVVNGKVIPLPRF